MLLQTYRRGGGYAHRKYFGRGLAGFRAIPGASRRGGASLRERRGGSAGSYRRPRLATFFGPQGGYEQGPNHVHSVYERDAARFISGDSSFEILQMAASDGIAYWVGLQRATACLEGSAEPIPFDLRVTEVFRREGEEWKLVHRHADTLASETQARKR